jgi:predicted DNA-binding transcriptional regulator AlpA
MSQKRPLRFHEKGERDGMKHNAEPLMSTIEAGEYVGLAEQTMRAKRSRGDSPLFVVVSRNRILYRRSDLDEWIAARVAKNTADARLRGLTGPDRAA